MTTIDKETMENILEGVGAKLKYFGMTNVDFPFLSSVLDMSGKDRKVMRVLLKGDIDYIAKTSAFLLYMAPYQKDTLPFLSRMKNKILYNALSVVVPPGKESYNLMEHDDLITATHERFVSAERNTFQFSLEVTIGRFYSAKILGRMRAQ